MKAFCVSLLPDTSLLRFWILLFVLLVTIAILVYYSGSTTINPQTCVSIHSLVNQCLMCKSTLLVLIMHYNYGLNYPLIRSSRSSRVDCILHSSLSIISFLIPSSSLELLTVIHYRAVFWARFAYKLEMKHILRPVLLVWIASLILASLWTTFHGPYSSWYCVPFTSTTSWFSIVLQSIISFICVTSLGICVSCYCRMIMHLHQEENIVQAMRSRNISNTRMMSIRFTLTFLFHLSQGVLLHVMMWMPLFGYDEWICALINVLYIISVVITDIYMHAYISLKKTMHRLLTQINHKYRVMSIFQ